MHFLYASTRILVCIFLIPFLYVFLFIICEGILTIYWAHSESHGFSVQWKTCHYNLILFFVYHMIIFFIWKVRLSFLKESSASSTIMQVCQSNYSFHWLVSAFWGVKNPLCYISLFCFLFVLIFEVFIVSALIILVISMFNTWV